MLNYVLGVKVNVLNHLQFKYNQIMPATLEHMMATISVKKSVIMEIKQTALKFYPITIIS